MPDAPPIERLSPDGRHRLIIRPVPHDPNVGSELDLTVLRTADGQLVGTSTRNYGNHHILQFVAQDGRNYLILSEDYHGGHGAMDLETGEKATFNPTEGSDEGEQFWCWAGVESHDPVARALIVIGCYWGCPYERTTFDFSQPLSPPYPVLRVEEIDD